MIGNKISVPLLLIIMVPSMILVAMFCYFMAIYYDYQQAFPNQTVTHTASFYPQDIIFRFIMLFFSSTLTLMFYIIIKWIDYTSVKIGFQKMSKVFLFVGMFSMLCFTIAIGTIDGKGRGPIHKPIAAIFFIIWAFGTVCFTVRLTRLYYRDAKIISKISLAIKQVISVCVALLWIYCLFNLFVHPVENKEHEEDIHVIEIQWNAATLYLLWLLSFGLEWKKISIRLKKVEIKDQNKDLAPPQTPTLQEKI